MLPQKTTVLEQKVFLRGSQRLEITQDGDLKYVRKQMTSRQEFKIPLWQINPNAERIKRLELPTLIVTIVAGLIALFVISKMFSQRDASTLLSLRIITGILLFVAGICFWSYQNNSINSLVFYFRHGGGIPLWHNKPNAETFEAFSHHLSTKAEEAWNNQPVDAGSQTLSGELTALKKLNDSGVLNDEEFERAKAKLLDKEDERRIGF